jgi:hypothetical protein
MATVWRLRGSGQPPFFRSFATGALLVVGENERSACGSGPDWNNRSSRCFARLVSKWSVVYGKFICRSPSRNQECECLAYILFLTNFGFRVSVKVQIVDVFFRFPFRRLTDRPPSPGKSIPVVPGASARSLYHYNPLPKKEVYHV